MPLPIALQQHIDALAMGADHASLNRAAADVSARYRRDHAGASLALKNDTEALAYAAARMPATFAAVEHVFAQMPEAQPASLLDFGAGPGTATLAALARWPGLEARLLEPNMPMRAMGQKLLPDAVWVDAPASSDIVIAAYVLNEIANISATIEKLWAATNDRLVLIDTGTPAGSKMMRDVRVQLIAAGAYIHAPCPHMAACPFSDPAQEGWCHFSVRLERTKLHKNLKEAALGYEDEKFTYLIAGRAPRLTEGARVIGYPRIGKVMGVPLCLPEGVLTTAQISKRDPRYKAAKKIRWGDTL